MEENRPKILDIPEKDVQGRQHQADAESERHQHEHGIDKREELPRESDAVEQAQNEENGEREEEVDKGLACAGEDKDILRHVDLGEYRRIDAKREHPLRRGLVEKREYDVAAEKIGRVMLDRAAEEV